MINKKTGLLPVLLIICCPVFSQDDLEKLLADSTGVEQVVSSTFKSDYIASGQSNETLHRHELRVNISHRFDDIAGSQGGIRTFFGVDNATDIKIALDYGINDRLTLGVARVKGAAEQRAANVYFNSLTQLWEGKLKYRLIQQSSKMPFAVTLFTNAVLTTRSVLDEPASDAHFELFGDRWSFAAQAIIARKINRNFSLAVLPSYLRRNFTGFRDAANLFALGIGARIKYSRRSAIVADYFLPFRNRADKAFFKQQGVTFYNPLSIGWEIETGGHVFHVLFTNATALLENQFIPYTTRSWTKGEFRMGFTIARTFNIGIK